MSRLTPATPLADILEKDWQRTVTDLAKQLGWTLYHTHDSRRSAHGFPDLVLVRDRVIYIELKRENRTTSKLTDDQVRWLRSLRDAGAEVYVARPSHLDQLAKILAQRVKRYDADVATRQSLVEHALITSYVPTPLRDELDDELGRRHAA